MRLKEIAQRFGLKHYASASSSIRQFKAHLAKEQRLQNPLKLIKLDLTLTQHHWILKSYGCKKN